MRILLVKPKHIGDSLLLTPTIVAIKQARPDAEIWVVVRRGCEGILAGCPEIDRLLTVAAVDREERHAGDFWRGLATLLRLLGPRFDFVFELGDGHRARLIARSARARRRYSVRPATPLPPREARAFAVSRFDWETCHRVEKDFYSVSEFFPLPHPVPPLRFDRRFARAWPPGEHLSDFVVMQIGKRQTAGRWHAAKWEEVGQWLLGQAAALVVSTGPAPQEVNEAEWLCEQFGVGALPTLGRANWAQMADLLYRARLYVGTDTATMHLAAACGCPVVALFGSTWEGHWRPWQSPHRIVTEADAVGTGDAKEDLARARRRTMAGISTAQVISACRDLLAQAGPVRTF